MATPAAPIKSGRALTSRWDTGRRRFIAQVALNIVALTITNATAQSIERNSPPAPLPSAPALAPVAALADDQNATTIGPALAAIVTLGATDATALSAQNAPASNDAPVRDADGPQIQVRRPLPLV